MPATGLLALLDDITAILDDVAAMSKVAAQKTAGIVGDDLAVNAQGLVGLDPDRELPIVGKVALGSLANKFVLVPLALLLPAPVIPPVLMLGGTYLCYEGVHKVLHKHDPEDEAHHEELVEALKAGPEALAKVEAGKVRQAIITDVVLSAEIVAVALGTVSDQPFAIKATTLTVIALGMTVVVYGLVAGLVKLDDIGLSMTTSKRAATARLGQWILVGTPYLMRTVSVVGTVAMFLVGGGIVLHNIHPLEEAIHHALEAVTHNGVLLEVGNVAASMATGLVLGGIVHFVVEGIKALVKRARS